MRVKELIESILSNLAILRKEEELLGPYRKHFQQIDNLLGDIVDDIEGGDPVAP